MKKIKIVTDSTVELSKEVLDELNITVVPLSIVIDNVSYLDRVNITPVQFLDKMRKASTLPKSSQPAAGEFLKVYNELVEDGTEVLSIHMTGNMSGTVRSAETAADMCDGNVTVVDSRFISYALSFQVVEAAKMAQEGKTMNEILSRLDVVRKNTYLFVVVDTLENLVKGGRIGKGQAMLGSLLNIKPIASLDGGEYTPVAKVRSHNQVAKFLAKQFVQDTEGKTIIKVCIAHAEGMKLAKKVVSEITALCGYNDIQIDYTTPIISTHTGHGAIGFSYYAE